MNSPSPFTEIRPASSGLFLFKVRHEKQTIQTNAAAEAR
jgi:hypothetical protein